MLTDDQRKELIAAETGLSASAGVSCNKFLAKIASDMDKPDGLFVITPAQAEAFIAGLPVRRFHGIGAATERRMHALGVRTGADLRRRSEEQLVEVFGKAGAWYYRVRKSLGKETTFASDLGDLALMRTHLETLAAEVAAGLAERKLAAHTLTLKLKYDNFELITRSHTPGRPESHPRGLPAAGEDNAADIR